MEVYCIIHKQITTLSISDYEENEINDSQFYRNQRWGDDSKPPRCKLCDGSLYCKYVMCTGCCGEQYYDTWICCQPSIIGKIKEKYIINENKIFVNDKLEQLDKQISEISNMIKYHPDLDPYGEVKRNIQSLKDKLL